jgi:hypothetical protein
MINVGLCFSKPLAEIDPLAHITSKYSVYTRLLDFMAQKGWQIYVFTRKTYQGNGVFQGAWVYQNGKFSIEKNNVKADLVYDRSAGVNFPPGGDESVIWVNRRDFKVLAWDKWLAYQKIGKYMPQTIWIENRDEVETVISQIKSDWVVLKPFNGLKGLGIFIGSKADALNFKLDQKYKNYIAQEFVDTSKGIKGITGGRHDLRVAIVNGKAVWCHVRIPPEDSFLANAAQGGELTELDYDTVPGSVKEIVKEISEEFYREYDNPIYSLDFGLQDGQPYIFEINDQIGFPKWEMKNRDAFLKALVDNFESKLAKWV